MDSESGDEMEFEGEDEDEILEHETETLALLRSEKLTLKNPDGTLRCPLSPSRKKQAYAYKDLLQHATGVAGGSRGPEAAGKHRALKKFLEADLSLMAPPPVERLLKVEQEVPRRRNAEDMLVFPWSVVIYNIDNSRRDSTQGIHIGLGKKELTNYFADYNPEKVNVFWGPLGHQGMCVLTFKRDLSGLKDAQALEKSFLDKEHGRRDFERNLVSRNLGNDFYGWLAGEEDFKGGKFGLQSTEIAKYLAKYGKLMDIAMVGDEIKRMHEQQVRQLALAVSEKDEKNLTLRTEMEIVRRNAEADRLRQQEAHKLELEAVRGTAQKFEDAYHKMALDTKRALEKKDSELGQREKELKEKECNLQSEAERIRLETQMMENRRQREMVSREQGKLKQSQAGNLKLVQQQQEEARALDERAHNEALQLARKHKRELEVHQLNGMLEMSFDLLTIKEDKDRVEESKTIEDLKKQMEELESAQEYNEDTINSLVKKERKANDEIADAQKRAVRVLEELSEPDSKAALIEGALQEKHHLDKTGQITQQKVEVRRVGSIDSKHWEEAFRKKFGKNDDWQLKMMKSLSRWGDTLRKSTFQPFIMVKTGDGDDDRKQEIDHGNKDLAALKKDFGIEVYNSVTTALLEIEEYNASGRYPIPIAWISDQTRRATLEEVIAYLGQVIEALVANRTNPRKKVRR